MPFRLTGIFEQKFANNNFPLKYHVKLNQTCMHWSFGNFLMFIHVTDTGSTEPLDSVDINLPCVSVLLCFQHN